MVEKKINPFCIFQTAEDWDRRLWKLGGQRLKKLKSCSNLNGKNETGFETWKDELLLVLNGQPKKNGCCGPKNKNKVRNLLYPIVQRE